MFKQGAITVLLGLASIVFPGYSAGQESDARAQEEVVTATIHGSAESPDPILAKVLELEEKGVLTIVVIMESFPVQIEVTGPRKVIDELESMPRKGGSGPQ